MSKTGADAVSLSRCTSLTRGSLSHTEQLAASPSNDFWLRLGDEVWRQLVNLVPYAIVALVAAAVFWIGLSWPRFTHQRVMRVPDESAETSRVSNEILDIDTTESISTDGAEATLGRGAGAVIECNTTNGEPGRTRGGAKPHESVEA